MSAFILNPEHIGALAHYYAWKCGKHTQSERKEIATILAKENMRSIDSRYGEHKDMLPYIEGESTSDADYIASCVWASASSNQPVKPVVIIKLAHSYRYQSCESDDYFTTEGARLIDRLIDTATHHLDGYDAAPWEYSIAA